MNHELNNPYIADEVKVVLYQMNPTKALRPNGMAPLFFQSFWHIVGESITTAIMKALNKGTFSSSLYHTSITLIPKKKN